MSRMLALAVCALLAAAPPAFAAADLDRSAFVGAWTDNGDCSVVTVLQDDGIFVAPNGARGGWTVEGETLKIWGPGGVVSWTVRFDDPNTMILTSPDGSTSQSTRCPADVSI